MAARAKRSPVLIDESPPDFRNRSALEVRPGRYLMRNGHTAKIERRIDLPYVDRKGKSKIYPIWKGICVDCGAPMTWTINGCYAAVGRHRSDLVERA